MQNIYKQFQTDKSKETSGTWVDLGDETSPSFKISRMSSSNLNYVKALEKATRRHKSALKVGALSPEKAIEIEKQVFCETIIMDWKNVSDANDQPISFNKENALKVLTDLPDLYEFLREQATEASAFKEYVMEEDAKN